MSDPVERAQLEARLAAVRTEAFNQAGRINVLKTVLLAVVIAAVFFAVIISASRLFAPLAAADRGADKETAHRIIALEKELALLKADLKPVPPANPWLDGAKAVFGFVIENWVLLSFAAAAATAFYVKVRFGIDYFESYRDLSTKKMLSQFYQKLGDRMMVMSEWGAAEEAYRNAIEINPTNQEATYGVAKTRIFQPLKGQKYYAPDVADAKLDYLIKNQNLGDDAQLYFLKSLNRYSQGDAETALSLLDQVLGLDPDFVGAHLQKGYMLMGGGEFEPAKKCFIRALELDPSYSLANNNLGFCHLITLELDDAIRCLQVAWKVCRMCNTGISIGDAYRYQNNIAAALEWHRMIVSILRQRGIESDRFLGGQWIYSYMPLRCGDLETIKQAVYMFTFEQKKMVALFTLSFDLALSGDIPAADKHFAEAAVLDGTGDYHPFIINKIESLLNLLTPPTAVRAWFEEKKLKLQPRHS